MKGWLPSSRVEVRDGDKPKKFFTATRRTKISTALIIAVNVWLLFFIGCAPKEKVWVKSGATTQDFNQDKYRCLQESNRKAIQAIRTDTAAVITPIGDSTTLAWSPQAGLWYPSDKTLAARRPAGPPTLVDSRSP